MDVRSVLDFVPERGEAPGERVPGARVRVSEMSNRGGDAVMESDPPCGWCGLRESVHPPWVLETCRAEVERRRGS